VSVKIDVLSGRLALPARGALRAWAGTGSAAVAVHAGILGDDPLRLIQPYTVQVHDQPEDIDTLVKAPLRPTPEIRFVELEREVAIAVVVPVRMGTAGLAAGVELDAVPIAGKLCRVYTPL
jgi:hypothetical protein